MPRTNCKNCKLSFEGEMDCVVTNTPCVSDTFATATAVTPKAHPVNEKITLEAEGVKRTLPVPFNMCCDADMLDLMIRQLTAARNAGHNFGWISIHLESDPVVDTPAKPWTS